MSARAVRLKEERIERALKRARVRQAERIRTHAQREQLGRELAEYVLLTDLQWHSPSANQWREIVRRAHVVDKSKGGRNVQS